MQAIYELGDVRKVYNERTVVNINELQIRQGEVLAIVGPSGAGKSTLLRLLAFLERSSAGRITYLGRECSESWPDLSARRSVTMVFQRPQLLKGSVIENVAYGLGLRGFANGRHAIAGVLSELGLASLADAPARTLSGGEMQRVALARAIVLDPQVLLLDEATANLDPHNIRLIEGIVTHANEAKGTTIVMVTHNIFQARRLAHRVALMLSGRLVEVADKDEFFDRPGRAETAAFVRGELIY